MMPWIETYMNARLGENIGDGRLQCHLCPRRCKINDGHFGFCGVRGAKKSQLVTYTYGKGVHMTEEVIETEAVNHFSPGAKILSCGNIGCNLNCCYCQNWKTSQSRFVEEKDVYTFSPEDVVEMAIRHNIGILSWTYNDPVVWQEFLIDTAKLARQAGLLNLYKSAFYITEEAVDQLLPYVDIFSISLKSVDDEYYRKATGGRVQPVLDGIKQVHRAGKHLEISNLMVTDLSDSEESARRVAVWVLENIGTDTPLHYVRFHPEYGMCNTVRTPIDRLRKAREIAVDIGIEHVYLGNVFDPSATSTVCRDCGELLVERFGLTSDIVGLDAGGRCAKCGYDAHIKLPKLISRTTPEVSAVPAGDVEMHTCRWRGDVCLVHIQIENYGDTSADLYYRPCDLNGNNRKWRVVTVAPRESYRFVIAKGSQSDVGTDIALPSKLGFRSHELFDRAHFPTVPLEEAVAEDDQTPLPRYGGRQISAHSLIRRS